MLSALLDVFYQYTHFAMLYSSNASLFFFLWLFMAEFLWHDLLVMSWVVLIGTFTFWAVALSLEPMSSTTRISQYTIFIHLYTVTGTLSITYSVHHWGQHDQPAKR